MKKILYFLLLVFLTGCQQNNPDSKIDNLQSQITDLQNKVSELSSDYTSQQQFNRFIAASVIQTTTASFNPASEGYAVVNSNVGNFLVNLVKLQKYADGYKAIFNIGNPNYLIFNGIKVTVSWGTPYNTTMNYGEWLKSLSTNTVEINKPLFPGMWNNIEVVLSPATPEQTGYIGVSIAGDKVLLSSDLRPPNN